MGKYAFILGTITSFTSDLQKFHTQYLISNGLVLLIFALGCGTGLLSFARVISWALKKHWDITMSLLTGFMLGSLNKVWPWKEVVQTHVDRHGMQKPLVEKSIMPQTYLDLGQAPEVITCTVMMIIGIAIVLFVDKLSSKSN